MSDSFLENTDFTGRSRRCGTLQAAPPLMIDFTKMPRSAWFSLDRFPLTLTPSPAEPESLRGISKVRNSLVPSGVRTRSSSSVFWKRQVWIQGWSKHVTFKRSHNKQHIYSCRTKTLTHQLPPQVKRTFLLSLAAVGQS